MKAVIAVVIGIIVIAIGIYFYSFSESSTVSSDTQDTSEPVSLGEDIETQVIPSEQKIVSIEVNDTMGVKELP